MRGVSWRLAIPAAFLLAAAALPALQRGPFQRAPFQRGFDSEGPFGAIPTEQSTEHTEFGWSRLRYDSLAFNRFRGGNWSRDYPKADRQFLLALRRLTRIDARSAEQPINVEADDDVFNYPWLYAVEVGHWELSDKQVAKLREFFDRGGFFMCDDFHGSDEWDVFVASFKKIFPDRHIVDISNNDPIFHTVFDLDERYQVPGMQYTQTHRVYEKDGIGAEFRAIYDDHGRIIAAICHNMDLGDSWENADEPTYPQKFSALGIRIGINYIIYAMTH